MTMEGVINNNINLIPKFDEIFPIVKICWSGNHICEEIVSLIFYGKRHINLIMTLETLAKGQCLRY